MAATLEYRVDLLEKAVLEIARRLEALEARSPGQYEPGTEPALAVHPETED